MYVNYNLLIAIFMLIFSNIATCILIITVGLKIYQRQGYISTVFDNIVKNYSKNGDSNGR